LTVLLTIKKEVLVAFIAPVETRLIVS
jgi:hypothetical protein